MGKNPHSLVDAKGLPLESKDSQNPNLEHKTLDKVESEDEPTSDSISDRQDQTNWQSKDQFKMKNPSFWQNLKKFFRFQKGRPKNLRALLIIAAVIILLVIAGVTAAKRYIGYQASTLETPIIKTIKNPEKVKTQTVASKLDGTQVEAEIANKHPLAIMIENHPDARPQAGLEGASIVYETVAEGGITRFMAIFGPNESNHVGPVRSARTYFIDWALEYNAFYTHAGGSGNGLAKIKTDKVLDLDYNFNPNKAFWRESKPGINSEHTLYVDTKKLREIAYNYKKWSKDGDFTEWQFKTDLTTKERPQSGQVTINFSSPSYKVIYNYDAKTNTYKRTMAGLTHKDVNSGRQLAPKNIIIQKVTRTEVDSLGKTVGQITDIGTGDAWIVLDGRLIEGSWSKKEAKRRTLFYNQEGTEVKFNPGQTFIEIISGTSNFNYTVGEVKKSADTSKKCQVDDKTCQDIKE